MDLFGNLRDRQHALDSIDIDQPFRWSEDFGVFTAATTGALFGIGSGVSTPELHHQTYDFPEEVIPIAERLFVKIIDHYLV